jgi:hypothetical protein
VARARSAESVTTPTEPTEAAVPLSGATWTQGADEVDQIIGQITYTIPATTECNIGPSGSGAAVRYKVLLDGNELTDEVGAENGIGPRTETVPIFWSKRRNNPQAALLYEPGQPTSHTLTVKGRDQCGLNGGPATKHFTINSVSIDVIGVR